MICKNGCVFTKDTLTFDKKRIINQLWKLIPMRENQEDWQTHLKVVIEEIYGLGKVLRLDVSFLILLSKLEGLESDVCNDFMIYRKTVFRCIEIFARVINSLE